MQTTAPPTAWGQGMNLNDLRDQLANDEGLRLFPYVDTAGKTSIGVGRNLTDKGISHAEAMTLLDNDIAEVVTGLNAHIPWWTRLDDARQAAVANMCFNLGIAKFLLFRKMLDHLARGEYDA